MLTEDEALAQLEDLLREWGRQVEGGLTVLHQRTVTLPYGWIFTYVSTRYMESGATVHAVGVHDPVVVIAATGEVVKLSSKLSLAELERARGLEPRPAAEMLPFAKAELEGLSPDERTARCRDLGETLTARIETASNFHHAVGRLVSELRMLGHDLWSFDESDDFEIWCPDYGKPSGPGIVVTFHADRVEVVWSQQERDATC